MTNVKTWKGRVQRAYAFQQNQHTFWEASINLYNCTNDKLEIDPERVDVHFVNWYIDLLTALVYFRDPYQYIRAENSAYTAFAQTMEEAVNLMWRKLGMKQQFKRIIKSGFITPPGWIKIGYTAKIGQDIAKIEEEEKRTLFQNLVDGVKGIFKKEAEKKTPEQQGILNQWIEEENIFACWIPSWNMLMPEGYQLIENMPYLVEIEDMAKIDFLVNPFYKNKTNIKPDRQVSLSKNNSLNLHKPGFDDIGGPDSETDIIRLYHIQDRRQRKNITISMESDEPHFEGNWYPAKDGFDYEPLIFEETLPNLNKSNPYPPNAILPIYPQILEQSNARTQMAKWRKRASVIILAQEGLAREEDMRQWAESEAVQIIRVSNIAAYQLSQVSNLPSGVFEFDNIIKQDLQMGTNMGQTMFMAQPGQRTATQARIGQSGLEIKTESRIDMVEIFSVRVASKMAYHLWNFFDRQKMSRLLGKTVTPDMWPDLPDDPKERMRIVHSGLQFRIDSGSAAPPRDETVDRKQWLDAMSIISTIAPDRLKKDEAVKSIIRTFKYIKDLDRIVISNDEEEIQAALKENELMAQGMIQVVSPNENHSVHIPVHNQMAGQPLADQHILEHAKKMGISTGKSGVSENPQQGDIRPPEKSANPEINRQGLANEGDIYQATQNLGVGTGAESV